MSDAPAREGFLAGVLTGLVVGFAGALLTLVTLFWPW